VTINGRVASLLEVGTGFHPELTGRENIYLNGAILGMTRAEIGRKFDEIVAFAEIEKVLDTPVKRYSSGMYVRLAFAVAAHLEPEILVVDEVLSVGDVQFQQKCLGKMSEVAGSGRTVLFVSHLLPALASLCTRAILLERGRVRMTGALKNVVDHYLLLATKRDRSNDQSWRNSGFVSGNEQIQVHHVDIVGNDKNDKNVNYIEMGSPFEIIIDYSNHTTNTELITNLYVYSTDGTAIFESLNLEHLGCGPHAGVINDKLVRSTCLMPADLLNEGEYYINISFLTGRLDRLFHFENAASFSIRDLHRRDIVPYYGHYAGYIHPKLTWRTEVIYPLIEEECVDVS
jgi:lipopolysaccharide transport system ATP-binding protein